MSLFNNLKIYIFLASFFIFPLTVSAQVIINEIAWMGTENSANDEWIELKNTSTTTIDISGWVLEAEDGSPKITLSGSILKGDFFILERSDDFSIPDIKANQIYKGALSNSGEILTLKNLSGVEVDRVNGSNNWELGGDKALKYTLQKFNSDWVTATATPKFKNNNQDNIFKNDNSNNKEVTATKLNIGNKDKNSKNSSKYQKEQVFVRANAGVNIIAEAGQKIFFDASKSEGENLKFSWNLGNGETKEGESFLYDYKFPGRYLVTLVVKSASFTSQDQIDVVVYPTGVLISEFYPGSFESEDIAWIEIYNSSDNFIDLSSWRILSDFDEFFIPKETFVAPFSYLVFSSDVLGWNFLKNSKNISLVYPNGQLSDTVSYEIWEEGFSASRKNKTEFVWTKNKSPGFKNIIIKSENNSKDQSKIDVKNTVGVSLNRVKKNWASFVLLNGQKSFLIKPVKAEVVGVDDSFNKLPNISGLDLSANLSSVSFINLFFIFLVGILTAFLSFWLGRKKI